MLTTKLTHPEILYHLARAGHGAKILITDGNYPASTKIKESVPVVYLNLGPDQPTVLQILVALSSMCNWEVAEVMCPDDGHRPAIFDEFQKQLSLELKLLKRYDFYSECMNSGDLALAIVSGETRPYANVLLTVGVSN